MALVIYFKVKIGGKNWENTIRFTRIDLLVGHFLNMMNRTRSEICSSPNSLTRETINGYYGK